MSFSCFFGAELRPDGKPFTPVIPPGSSLILTQCAVTSAVPEPDASAGAPDATSTPASPAAAAVPSTYSAVTLYVQSSEVPSRLAVCTLSPGQQLYYCPLQLIFSRPVTLTLLPQHKPMKAGAPVAYPTVHVTGYYEKEESDDGSEDDEEGGEVFLRGASESSGEGVVEVNNRARRARPPTRAGSKRPARD